MRKLDKKWKIALYGCSGLGLNMMNIIMGTHLCNALIADGFEANAESWTYNNRTLVVVGIWMVLSAIMKILDGVVDIPLSSFTDNLRTRWGRRRPAIVIGLIPLLLSYVLFLIPLSSGATLLNTLWFVLLLGIFYCAYTLTMITYYATFAEIVETEGERMFLSNIKSVCDVVYFSLNFALVPLFVGMGINIRFVALIFLPLAATMLIPLFLIKEPSTKEKIYAAENVEQEKVGFIKSFAFAFKNKRFIYWLCIVAVMNIGLQLFLGGISVFFSNVGEGLNMTFVMASAFVPVPLTLILYNKVVKKKGVKFAFQYILLTFSIGMSLMIVCPLLPTAYQLIYAIFCAIIVSFSIGAFFSITYTIPSQLAAEENAKTGVCASSMYFAVQGLFEAISASLATQVILVVMRTFNAGETESGPLVKFIPIVVAGFCMIAFFMAFFLPESIARLGKENKESEENE